MWTTLIPAALAGAICLGVVNLASEIKKVREARNSPALELTAQRIETSSEQLQRSPTIMGGRKLQASLLN